MKNSSVNYILSILILVFYVSLIFNRFCACLLSKNKYGFKAGLSYLIHIRISNTQFFSNPEADTMINTNQQFMRHLVTCSLQFSGTQPLIKLGGELSTKEDQFVW